MKKVFAMLLLLAMLVGCFAACKKDDTPGTETSPAGNDSSGPSGSGEEEDPNYTPSVDLTAEDFGGETIRLLQCEYKQDEFYTDGTDSAETVAAKVFRRNARVEADLNILIDYATVDNPSGLYQPLQNAVSQSVLGNDPSTMYHVVANPAYYSSAMISAGLFKNIASIEDNFIDITRYYWSQDYIEKSMINNRYYFLVGELCTSVIERTEVMFVNKQLFNNYFPDLGKTMYDIVYDREWTYERMLEMIAVAGDGASTMTYGLALPVNSWSIDGMQAAMELDMLTVNSLGIPQVNVNTEHNSDLISAMRELYYENSSVTTTDPTGVFAGGQAIFTATLMLDSPTFYDAGISYSLIPHPMWDSTQEDYIITPHDEYTALSICSNVANTAAVTAFLEDMAYRSHSTTYPAVFYETYQLRYNENPEDAEMYDFIYEHLSFSMGAIYSFILGECKNIPRYLLYPADRVTPNINSGIQSNLTSLADSMEIDLADFLEIFYSVG